MSIAFTLGRFHLSLVRPPSRYPIIKNDRFGYPSDPSSPQFMSVFFVVKEFTITYHAPIARPGPVSVQF